ncbi:MAG: S41 family peptidase [Candidatus Niyogibacteria bacterium]|nr:S41 family peptidase [Candidatus Niyogibacteria bacterium]
MVQTTFNKIFLKNKKTVLGAVFFLSGVLIFLSGAYFGYNQRPAMEKILSVVNKDSKINSQAAAKINFEPFWKTWNAIEEKYVSNDGLSGQEMVWGAIEGMTKSLKDPYTVFFPPKEKEMFESQIRGDFEGVGMEIGIRNNILTVISPLKGTPAHRAGIKTGDMILKVDEKPTMDMTIDEAVRLIRGQKGTKVILIILRKGEEKTREISVIRDRIEIPAIETNGISRENSGKKYAAAEKEIFIIRLFNFNENALAAFRGALREMALSGKNKLILDLRSNPGGYLEVAVDIASWWLPMGKIVAKEKFSDGRETLYRSKGYGALRDIPTVILLNEGSASASEILAGALNEHGKATLVGEKTFGKGSVQEIVPITKETFLKVTIARWLTPNGRSISEKGLEPDVTVAITAEDEAANRDPQMEKAIELLTQTQG